MNELAATIIESVWRASWQGAIAICLVWFICRTWKRIPSTVHCTLWVLVCLKLIITLIPAAIAIPCLPTMVKGSPLISGQEGSKLGRTNSSQSMSHPTAGKVGEERTGTGAGLTRFVNSPNHTDLSQPANLTQQGNTSFVKSISSTPDTLFASLWLIGVFCVGAYSARQLGKSLRLIRNASPCTDDDLVTEAEELCQSLRLRVKPRILITSDPAMVMTVDALRPVVLISANTLADCTQEEKRMILAHEFAHIRRKDAWLGLIPLCAQTLFFFHPMVWLACKEFSFAREAACDEEAISCLQIGTDLYGRLLLKLGSRRQPATTLCTPGVSSHFHLLRRRIAMLDNATVSTHRRPMVLTCLIGALCIAPLSLVQGQFAKPASLKTSFKASSKALGTKSAAKHGLVTSASRKQIESKTSLHVFRLKNADAEKATSVLRQVLDFGTFGRVAADSKSNSIIVNADDATTAQIASVIKNLDDINRGESRGPTFPKEPQQVTVYTIRFAETNTLLNVLRTLYGTPANAVVKVASDPRTNSIIVTAPENRTHEVTALITKLDVPTPDDPPEKARVIRVIRVRNGDAQQLIERINAMLKKDAPEYMARDLVTNDIIVRATEEKCNQVQMLVDLLGHPKS